MAKEFATIGLYYASSNPPEPDLRVYAYASFFSNDDFCWHLGYLILMYDDSNKYHVLDYRSKITRCVLYLIIFGELNAFMDASDALFLIAQGLGVVIGCHIPLFIYTDSQQLFDALKYGKRTTERRNMVDALSGRQSCKRIEIAGVALIRGSENPVGGFIKIEHNGALNRLLSTMSDKTEA